jgi:ElaB/YqjD/DUF883 family membrane-anchored ribosome-binding protein
VENESEVIRQQMDETRAAMSDKIETLENQVVDTVQAATAAVSETVGSVKDIVHDSLQTVKDSVQDTVESVKDTFDLPRQVNRRPWTMFAGAAALGYLGGYLLSGSNGSHAGRSEKSDSVGLAVRAHTAMKGNGASRSRNAAASAATQESETAEDKPTWVSGLGDTFHDEIAQLEGLAIGTLLGLVRDIVTKAVPEHMERQVEEIVDGITVKLGGKPLDGRILPEPSRVDGFAKNGKQEACG